MADTSKTARLSPLSYLAISIFITAAAAFILYEMGRVPICKCGYVKLWHGDPISSENSQHIADWYSLSHVVHGFLFFMILSWLAGRTSTGFRLALATTVEAAWEVFENTDFIINRYREATISLDYYGDSVLNSASDIAFMMVGFFLASRLPVWMSVAAVIALELIALYAIRDNLTLNIIMLLYPLDAIRNWQAGA